MIASRCEPIIWRIIVHSALRHPGKGSRPFASTLREKDLDRLRRRSEREFTVLLTAWQTVFETIQRDA